MQATLLEPRFPHVLGVFLIAEPALDRGSWVLRECSEENPEGWEGWKEERTKFIYSHRELWSTNGTTRSILLEARGQPCIPLYQSAIGYRLPGGELKG